MSMFYGVLIVALMILVIPIGNILIEAYFTRKEKFVEHLQSKIKENTNATCK